MQEKAHMASTRITPAGAHLTSLLVRIAETGDREAFAELFGHLAPRVKSYALKLGCDDAMAEEIAQQTLLKVWRKAKLFNPDKAAASTWVFRIARNLRIDAARRETHYQHDDYDMTTIEDEGDTPEGSLDRTQHQELVRQAMTCLPDEQVQVIRLSFYEGLSHGDIAEKLGLPLGTVKSRMRLAFGKLRESVTRLGGAADGVMP